MRLDLFVTRLLDRTYVIAYALHGGSQMKTITATDARKNLYRLMDEIAVSSDPVQITGRRSSAVLISEADWRALQETLYLLSIPGMRESIREGLDTKLEDCVEELDW
jgi:prevent-host-death family protein